MTKLLERAMQSAKSLPSHRQDELGEMVLAVVAQETSTMRLSPEQEAEVRRRMAQPSMLVSEADMELFFRKLSG